MTLISFIELRHQMCQYPNQQMTVRNIHCQLIPQCQQTWTSIAKHSLCLAWKSLNQLEDQAGEMNFKKIWPEAAVKYCCPVNNLFTLDPISERCFRLLVAAFLPYEISFFRVLPISSNAWNSFPLPSIISSLLCLLFNGFPRCATRLLNK